MDNSNFSGNSKKEKENLNLFQNRKSGVIVQSPILKYIGLLDNFIPNCLNSPIGQFGLLDNRKTLLDSYRIKQPFRVAIGKSKWVPYENFEEGYNLREILNDEIVIEFDTKEFPGSLNEFQNKVSWPGINFTAVNLYLAGYEFEIWDHKGKSPHLHIHNLPIANLSLDKRTLFKKKFIEKYVPAEYLGYCDSSLCGIHLIALELAEHWKGCYGVKELLHKWEDSKND